MKRYAKYRRQHVASGTDEIMPFLEHHRFESQGLSFDPFLHKNESSLPQTHATKLIEKWNRVGNGNYIFSLIED